MEGEATHIEQQDKRDSTNALSSWIKCFPMLDFASPLLPNIEWLKQKLHSPILPLDSTETVVGMIFRRVARDSASGVENVPLRRIPRTNGSRKFKKAVEKHDSLDCTTPVCFIFILTIVTETGAHSSV
ncbi:hypothetical protein L1987_20925 [Smallanthus sonchifolius]|uniref:Uncharacterized protein n=1 Tax=Smallanthus sonchifolius TaxID=185202 RepID=A0ACB9ITP8_9ASTR|nr:hypothetical protein L1987_20925 [Smallanthus sonchifolius]